MENGPFIDGLPIKKVIFRGYVSHNQMVMYTTPCLLLASPPEKSDQFPWSNPKFGGLNPLGFGIHKCPGQISSRPNPVLPIPGNILGIMVNEGNHPHSWP